MKHRVDRRQFFTSTGVAVVSAGVAGQVFGSESQPSFMNLPKLSQDQPPLYDISLAQWSLHRMLFAGKLDNLDFPAFAKNEFGIKAVEYVNQFFKDKAKDQDYLTKLKENCQRHGVESVLIMVDGEGNLGDPDPQRRQQAVKNHHRWVDAAKFLGCHSIRVNASSSGSYQQQARLAADGLRQLCDYAKPHGINVIVENHGGYSSNGQWLAWVIRATGRENGGTLPDFGNFRISENHFYDRYVGTSALMPFAKGVSAKSNDFDEDGNEIHTDYMRMLQIVIDSGYNGYIGIEYEGSQLSETEGIRATQRLLERCRQTLKIGQPTI